MRKILLLLPVVFLTLPALAQDDTGFERREVIIIDEDDDLIPDNPVVVSAKDRQYTGKVVSNKYKSRNHSFNFVGSVQLGYNGLVENLGKLRLPDEADFLSQKAKSVNFNLQFFTYHYHLARNFSLATGFELEVNNFRFDKNTSLMIDPLTGHTVADYSYNRDGIHLSKSKLVTGYVNVPLLLHYRFGPPRKQVYLQAGVVGGVRWFTYTKIKANSPELSGKFRRHSDYNIRNLHWGYTAGIGFKRYGFYATYYPNSLFRNGKGPDVKQVNIGVTLHL